MRTRSKLVFAGFGAALLLAFAIGTASARTFSISNQNIRATFNNLELGVEGLATITCHVSLEGSLHSRTIPKVAETLIGYITRVNTGQCNSGVTILTATLPWHVRYRSFSGTLPNITLILVRVFEAQFRVLQCLARGPIEARFIRNTATRELTGTEIPLQNVALTGTLCPEVGFFRSRENGSVTVLNSTERLTVTLI